MSIMLFIKTVVKPSRIHSLGSFANQNIKKGQKVWEYNSLIDRKFTKKQLAELPALMQSFVKFYSYLNDRNEFVFCGDNARYINHSDNPNILDIKSKHGEDAAIASQNIKKGEEITSKYLIFDKRGRAKHL